MLSCTIQTARLQLCLARVTDAPALLDYRISNREHMRPWEPLREDSYYTLANAIKCLTEVEGLIREKRQRTYLIRRISSAQGEDEAVIGACDFSQIMGGVFQACYLGYSLAQHCQGQGLMFEALQAAISDAVRECTLHRVMASYMPANLRSERLLERLGFEREGYAKSWLRINGRWEDHVLTSLITDTHDPAPALEKAKQ